MPETVTGKGLEVGQGHCPSMSELSELMGVGQVRQVGHLRQVGQVGLLFLRTQKVTFSGHEDFA